MTKKNIIPQLLDFEEKKLGSLYQKVLWIKEKTLKSGLKESDEKNLANLENQIQKELVDLYKNLGNWQKTQVARHPRRPYTLDYIERIFTDFVELHGDRNFGDDCSIVGGLALFDGKPVMILGSQKGRNTEENIKRNFGMAQPEGYRKALRLFRLAEKFNRPIITFVDTPGAYPGIKAEEHGQGEAIARNIKEMFSLTVPIISFIIGEGGSGGALALAVANAVYMLEHSIYSVISPESCASILWRDSSFREQAASALKNDAQMAKSLKVIDGILKEPVGGAHRNHEEMAKAIKNVLKKDLEKYPSLSIKEIVAHRSNRFTQMGVFKDFKDCVLKKD